MNKKLLKSLKITKKDIEKAFREMPKINTEFGYIIMPFGVPVMPALIIDEKDIIGCIELEELGDNLLTAGSRDHLSLVKVIANNGYEFHYEMESMVLRPDWFKKRWFKQDIINIYNSSKLRTEEHYKPEKKIKYMRIREIIAEICIFQQIIH